MKPHEYIGKEAVAIQEETTTHYADVDFHGTIIKITQDGTWCLLRSMFPIGWISPKYEEKWYPIEQVKLLEETL